MYCNKGIGNSDPNQLCVLWPAFTTQPKPACAFGLTALLAAAYGKELPVAYLSFGGYSRTGGVARYTRLNNADLLRSIANPDIGEADWASLRSRLSVATERLAEAPGLLPTEARNRDNTRYSAHGAKVLAISFSSGPRTL